MPSLDLTISVNIHGVGEVAGTAKNVNWAHDSTPEEQNDVLWDAINDALKGVLVGLRDIEEVARATKL